MFVQTLCLLHSAHACKHLDKQLRCTTCHLCKHFWFDNNQLQIKKIIPTVLIKQTYDFFEERSSIGNVFISSIDYLKISLYDISYSFYNHYDMNTNIIFVLYILYKFANTWVIPNQCKHKGHFSQYRHWHFGLTFNSSYSCCLCTMCM